MIIEEDNCLRLQFEVSAKDHWVIISTFYIGWIKAEEKEREIQTSVCSVMEPLRYGIASQKINMTSMFQRRPMVMLCTARDANVFLLLVMILFMHVATLLLSNLAATHSKRQDKRACVAFKSARCVLKCKQSF